MSAVWTANAQVSDPEPGATRLYAVAEFGEPDLPRDFTHFPYADPDAPRGGAITVGGFGSFDSVNSIPLRGEYARSIGLLHDTLMTQNQDEVGVYYPLIAESVDVPDDASWAIFNINPDARFHDGTPITAEDVAWTFNTVIDVGRPFLVSVYDDVTGVEALDDQRVRFTFATEDSFAPLGRVAGFTVLSRDWWTQDGRDLGEPTLEAPLGSGPYRLANVQGGRSLTYERVDDYWAADLPVNRGHWNFDRVDVDYYRDRTIMFEAFLGEEYDFRVEFSSRNWGIGYDTPAAEDGRIQRDVIPAINYRGMQGYFFNTRLPMFEDPRVREAMNYLYPFDFVNRSVMYGLRERMTSYFHGSVDYNWQGLPTGLEREILEEYGDLVPDYVFTEEPALPDSANPRGNGVSRENRRIALALMEDAGWVVRDGVMVNEETGEPMAFEILLSSPLLEPHTAPFVQELARVGVEASIRWVDSAQFQLRYQERDFEVIGFAYTFYPPPGGELRSRFDSETADEIGSANIAGITDPLVDALTDRIVAAETLEEKQAATRALDRVLLFGWYVVPHWSAPDVWVAYWNRFGFPDEQPSHNFGFPNTIGFQPTWWIDAELNEALQAEQG
ncbi:MAG: extracellular solute-binding protein [Pseudomonadota bacterium]